MYGCLQRFLILLREKVETHSDRNIGIFYKIKHVTG